MKRWPTYKEKYLEIMGLHDTMWFYHASGNNIRNNNDSLFFERTYDKDLHNYWHKEQ